MVGEEDGEGEEGLRSGGVCHEICAVQAGWICRIAEAFYLIGRLRVASIDGVKPSFGVPPPCNACPVPTFDCEELCETKHGNSRKNVNALHKKNSVFILGRDTYLASLVSSIVLIAIEFAPGRELLPPDV